MLNGMLIFCLNIPVLLVPKFFKFFENLLKDANNIDVNIYNISLISIKKNIKIFLIVYFLIFF